jgi:hypothetical protein
MADWATPKDVMGDVLEVAAGMADPPAIEFLREPEPGQTEVVVDGRIMTAAEVFRYNANLWRRLASQARDRAAQETRAAIGFETQAEFAEEKMRDAQRTDP